MKRLLSDTERLALVTDTIRHCREMRDRGMPSAAWTKALREAVHFTWERRGSSKHGSTRYASLAAEGRGPRELVYEHAVPMKVITEALFGLPEITPDAVKTVLGRLLVTVSITRDENDRLNRLGLQSAMPPDWDGTDAFARYRRAGIDVVERDGGEASTDRGRRTSMPSNQGIGALLADFADHPKLQAASTRVKATCRAICGALEAEGLRLSPELRRDGFTFASRGGSVRIDPKIEALRIKVGLNPHPPVPPNLVHGGGQPDWIVVRPEHEKIAVEYLRQFVRTSLR